MKSFILIGAAALALSACGGGGSSSKPRSTPPANIMDPAAWEVGPIINDKNFSVGVPVRPIRTADGFAIDLPHPTAAAGHVHYVTVRTGSLAGKSRIVMRYRVEAAEGVRILPKCCPDLPSIGPTIYFARADNDWRSDGGRWWATFIANMPILSGEYVLTAPLDTNWTSVLTMSAHGSPLAFASAKANAGRVGFTLGGGDGYGHGVYATGPARIVVTGFTIE